MTASVPLSHTTNSIRLAEWWWVLFVGSPSASVRELLQTRAEQPKNGELCNLVPGGTKDVFKTLRLDSLNSLTHKDIWQFCQTMDLTPLVLRLQEETVSFYRGLAVNDVYMASSQKLENADSILTKCNRLVLLEWKIDGRPAYTINGRPAQTLLFISLVDLSTRWLLFHNDFALFHSRGAALTVSVWLGPWSSLTMPWLRSKPSEIARPQRLAAPYPGCSRIALGLHCCSSSGVARCCRPQQGRSASRAPCGERAPACAVHSSLLPPTPPFLSHFTPSFLYPLYSPTSMYKYT